MAPNIDFDNLLFIMLYGGVTVFAAVACFYILFRRGNAFAPDVTPPERLRKWAAVFFGFMSLGHLWWIPSDYPIAGHDHLLWTFIGALLDGMLLIPTLMVTLLSMLQDRRRPVWPFLLAIIPLVVTILVSMINHDTAYIDFYRAYFLLVLVAFMIYMIHGVRQYGRWLRENYADLEHKEVWQSLLLLSVTLLAFAFYDSGIMSKTYHFVVQINDVLIIWLMLWRVETLSSLSSELSVEEPDVDSAQLPLSDEERSAGEEESASSSQPSVRRGTIDMAQLLKQHCEDEKLYLQYDLTLSQLAAAIGTNRTYLSEYFSQEGITYNSYINRLRIQHFVRIYHENVSQGQRLTAMSLAQQCGFKSYSTFGVAFKQFMGQTVTAWMKESV